MDIKIVTTIFSTCTTWRDVAMLAKANLNLRNLSTTKDGPIGIFFWPLWKNTYNYDDCVWWSEILAFFVAGGMKQNQAFEVAKHLEEMGFITTLDSVDSPSRNYVMRFLV